MRAIAAVTTPGETAALCHSVGLARASFYRRRRPTPSLPPPPSRAPSPRALAADERQAMLATLHSERFVDQRPRKCMPQEQTCGRCIAMHACELWKIRADRGDGRNLARRGVRCSTTITAAAGRRLVRRPAAPAGRVMAVRPRNAPNSRLDQLPQERR